MVTMCFVAKSPQPTTRVFGLGDIGIPLEEFQKEVLSLVAIPDEAMPATGLEEGDSFYYSSRGRIRGQTWTWLGHYRHAIDPGGRKGAYFATGVLLLNQICNGQAVAAMINALDVFFRGEILEDYQRIPQNWQSLQLSMPVKQLSKDTDVHVGELKPGFGLSPDANRLVYRRDSLTFGQVALFLDTLQSSAALQSSGRIVFGPSVHFAEKLNARLDLDAFDSGRAQAGVGLEMPERTAALRPENVQDVTTAGLPVAAREAARFFDSEPATNVSALDRKINEIWGALGNVQETAFQNNRAIRLHRRVAWLCVAIIVIAAGYGLASAIDGTTANAELTRTSTGRIVDILSAEIGKLKADIARLRITPPKPLATHLTKPPAARHDHDDGNSDDNPQSDGTISEASGDHQNHHPSGRGGNHHGVRAGDGGAATSDAHGGRARTGPSGTGGTKKKCRSDKDSYDANVPLCAATAPHPHG